MNILIVVPDDAAKWLDHAIKNAPPTQTQRGLVKPAYSRSSMARKLMLDALKYIPDAEPGSKAPEAPQKPKDRRTKY